MQKKGRYKRADLLKMHAYKDAIRRTVGAYVLYPGTQSYERRGFHEIIPGLGAFPVSPSNNGDGLQAVEDFIHEVVNHFTNRASQREQLSYHQYDIHKKAKVDNVHEMMSEYASSAIKVRAVPPNEVTVLVGYYKDDQQCQWIENQQLYNIRVGSKGFKYGSSEIGAQYLLLHGKGELETARLWEIVGEAPEIISKADLKNNKAYPSTPSSQHYLLYKLKPIKPNAFGGSIWDVRELAGYASGRASAIPFAVTLTELSKAIVSSA